MTGGGGRGDLHRLFTSRRFLLLWAAMLVSSTGTFFLLLTASASLLDTTGSGFHASAVFGFQWVLPTVLVGVVRRVCDRGDLRRTVVCVELGGAAVSLLIGLLLRDGMVAAVLACFLVRGLLEGITKTARVVYVRQLFDGPLLAPASYTFNNSYYLGSALGGVMGSLLAGRVPLLTCAAIDAATFVFSAACYRWLPSVSAPHGGSAPREPIWSHVRSVLRGRPGLAGSVVYLLVAVGVFQGFYSTARTVVPIKVMHLGTSTVMNLQIGGGAALVVGAFAAPLLRRFVVGVRPLGLVVNTATALALAAVPGAHGAFGLYWRWFVFLFLFECAFTLAQAEIIQRCPPTGLVSLTSFTAAVGNGLLVGSTLLAGRLSDAIDFRVIALLFAAFAVTAGLLGDLLVGARGGSGAAAPGHTTPRGTAPRGDLTTEERTT